MAKPTEFTPENHHTQKLSELEQPCAKATDSFEKKLLTSLKPTTNRLLLTEQQISIVYELECEYMNAQDIMLVL
eukprot:scaffold554360_cov31-Prasinocladus_malaysianus.AAC.1